MGGGEGVSYAFAEGAEAGDFEPEREGKGGGGDYLGGDVGGVWEGVEEGEVGGDLVALGWEVAATEGIEVGLGGGVEGEGEDAGHWRRG